MANFAAKAGWSQSSDGKTLNLIDLSNWAGNDQGYLIGNFTRSFVIKDAAGDIVATVPLASPDLIATYDVTEDQWLSVELVIDGVVDFTNTINVLLTRFTRNLRICLANKYCGSIPLGRVKNALDQGTVYIDAAVDEWMFGNGVGADKFIKAAYKWLNS